MGARRLTRSEVGLHGASVGGRYFDSVGRPRKLAAGAMEAIQREFERGGVTTRELGERYGISPSLVLTICYFTPKGPSGGRKRPAPERLRPVVVPMTVEFDEGIEE